VDVARLASQVRTLLAFHREIGISSYPDVPGVSEFLVNKEATPPTPAPPFSRTGRGTVAAAAPRKVSVTSARRQMERLVLEYTACNACKIEAKQVIPGQGTLTPRLFVAGDCFQGHPDDISMLWGREEDELFWKMMAAIGLDRESVFVSNCIKCSCKNAGSEELESGRRCFSFLERELTFLQPEIICTMGELSTSLVLKSTTPLVRIRGRFHPYRYPHGNKARVMPTFHPRFLLRHPEMKQAAWKDLQTIQHAVAG